MRYADRITFITEIDGGGYNSDTGLHDEGKLAQVTLPCNLSSLGIDRTRQLFGTLDKEITVARLQRPYHEDFDYALIKDRKYALTQHVPHRTESVFYLEGMA